MGAGTGKGVRFSLRAVPPKDTGEARPDGSSTPRSARNFTAASKTPVAVASVLTVPIAGAAFLPSPTCSPRLVGRTPVGKGCVLDAIESADGLDSRWVRPGVS